MTDSLLVLNVDVKVTNQDNRAVRANALFAAGELSRLHIALHDVDAILLVEGHTRDLIKTDNVVLAH